VLPPPYDLPPSPKLESYVADDSSFFASFSFRAAFMKSCGMSQTCLLSEVSEMQACTMYAQPLPSIMLAGQQMPKQCMLSIVDCFTQLLCTVDKRFAL